MKSRASIVLVSFFALFVAAACSDSQSPAAPAPAPTPAPSEPAPSPNPSPTPTPAPPAPTPTPTPPPPAPQPPTPGEPMSFTADTTSPASRSFSLQAAQMVEDDLYVTLYAHDFGGINGVNTINMVRATISYDPAVVSPTTFSSKDSWMESFGHQATFQVTKSGGNLIKVRVDSKDSFDGASGSGGILRLRFKKVAAGSSRLEITEGHAYGASFNDNLQATHGGTIVVK